MPTAYAPNIPNFKQPAETFHKPESAFIRLESLNVAANATTLDITAVLTTALATAGRNNTSVPLQVSTNIDSEGVITTAPFSTALVFAPSGEKFSNDADGAEVFATISEAGGVYSLNFFSKDNVGVDQPYTFPAGDLVAEIPYLFSAHNVPPYANIAITSRNVAQDPASGGGIAYQALTLAADNTIPSLNTPVDTTAAAWLVYRSWNLDANLTGSAVAIAANGDVTYDSIATGVNILAGERVVVYYGTP